MSKLAHDLQAATQQRDYWRMRCIEAEENLKKLKEKVGPLGGMHCANLDDIVTCWEVCPWQGLLLGWSAVVVAGWSIWECIEVGRKRHKKSICISGMWESETMEARVLEHEQRAPHLLDCKFYLSLCQTCWRGKVCFCPQEVIKALLLSARQQGRYHS